MNLSTKLCQVAREHVAALGRSGDLARSLFDVDMLGHHPFHLCNREELLDERRLLNDVLVLPSGEVPTIAGMLRSVRTAPEPGNFVAAGRDEIPCRG
jgi:hypothetical protein